jgi:hypothetical protein
MESFAQPGFLETHDEFFIKKKKKKNTLGFELSRRRERCHFSVAGSWVTSRLLL